MWVGLSMDLSCKTSGYTPELSEGGVQNFIPRLMACLCLNHRYVQVLSILVSVYGGQQTFSKWLNNPCKRVIGRRGWYDAQPYKPLDVGNARFSTLMKRSKILA